MHAIVMLLEKLDDPLVLLMGRERSFLVQGHRQCLFAEQFKIAANVVHFLLAYRVVAKCRLASDHVVILRVKVPPKKLVVLLRGYVFIKSLDGTEQLALVVALHVLYCKEPIVSQIVHNFGDDFFFGCLQVDHL